MCGSKLKAMGCGKNVAAGDPVAFHPSSAAAGDSLVGCGEEPAHVEDRVQRIERH